VKGDAGGPHPQPPLPKTGEGANGISPNPLPGYESRQGATAGRNVLLRRAGFGGRGPLLVLIGAQLAVGSAALMARAGLAAGLSPLVLGAWRLTVAAAIVLAGRFLTRGRSTTAAPSGRDRAILVVAGLCLSAHFVVWFASLRFIPVARSTLLVTTAPLWAGLGSIVFLRQRLPGRFWAGLAVAAVGAWLVTSNGAQLATVLPAGAGHAAAGDLLAILGAVAVAAYLLLTERRQTTLGTSTVIAWTYSSAAIWTWVALGFFPSSGGVRPPSSAAWLSVLGMAAVPQLIGHTSLNWCLRFFPAGVVSAATLLEPVFAGTLAWVLLGEPLTTMQLAGAAILLAGVALSLWNPPQPVHPARDEPAGAAI